MKKINIKIKSYWHITMLTVLMAVSTSYANAYPTRMYNNWEQTLAKLSYPDTLLTEAEEWKTEIELDNSDTIASEEYNAPEELNYCSNEVSTWASGGLSVLNYQPTFGSRDNQFGGTFGIGYTRYFSEHWGLLVGAELALYQSSFSQNKLHDNYDAVDFDPYGPQEMNFRYRVDKYKEKQQLWNINIPVMMQFQTKKQGNHRFFVAAGFKLGIPVSGKYESKNATIDSKGYYYDWNQTLNEPTSLGYGVFGNQSAKGKLDIGLSCIGSLETGVKWELPGGVNLYTGLYADYGFNDVIKGKHNDKFVVYDSYENEDFTVINSVLTSQYTPTDKTKNFTDKVAPLAFGVKLRLGFSVGCPVRGKQKQQKILFECPPCPSYEETVRQSAETAQKTIDTLQELVETIRKPETEVSSNQETVIAPQNTDIVSDASENYDFALSQIGKINYDMNVSTLTADQKKELDKYIAILNNNPSAKMILVGHACNRGSYGGNMRIGQLRADVAKEYLVQKGIQLDRIQTFSKGDTEPVFSNDKEEGRKKNRRLDVQIIR